MLGLFWLLCASVYKKRFPVGEVALSLIAALAFAGFSVAAREVGDFSRIKSTGDIPQLVEDVQTHSQGGGLSTHVLRSFSRFGVGLDGLILCMQPETARMREGHPDESWYALGSLGNLTNNVFCRKLVSSSPSLAPAYDVYLTQTVWGRPGQDSLSPVCRIGEAFFVAGWLGILLYPVIYAWIFNLIYTRFFQGAGNDLARAFYVCICALYVWPDDSLFFGYLILLFAFFLRWIMYADHLFGRTTGGSRWSRQQHFRAHSSPY